MGRGRPTRQHTGTARTSALETMPPVEHAPVQPQPAHERAEPPAQEQAPVSARVREERRARRWRGSVDGASDLRLKATIPLDPAYTYYWAEDTPAEIQRMQERDYDVVTEENHRPSASRDGTSHVLMRKHRDWYEEDQAVEQRALAAQERAITEASAPDGIEEAAVVRPKRGTNAFEVNT